jgi:uncharacterized protein
VTGPLLLLPPSKGKLGGGDGPSYASVLRRAHPLASARQEVLASIVAAASELSSVELARLTGSPSGRAEEQRNHLTDLGSAPTIAAHRRYTGVVHGNAGLAALDPATMLTEVRIVSGLLGLVALDEPVPYYRVEFAARVASLGGLATFWRSRLEEHLLALGRGRRVWDLLPAEHARVWTRTARERLEVVEVRFVRPDGRPANAARTKVCKGRIAAAIIAEPALGPHELPDALDPGAGWRLTADAATLVATFTGP